MKLHEYQSKRIFAQYGVPIPNGEVTSTPTEARAIAERIGKPVVIKSQVLVGGRGKAGGIRLAQTPAEAEEMAGHILGMDIKGMAVKKVLVDEAADIRAEIYLGAVLDRSARKVAIMASSEGGVEIEEVAAQTPEKIITVHVHPLLGMQGYQARQLAYGIGLSKEQIPAFIKIARSLYQAFVENDASLAEINPLISNADNQLEAVDGKILLDDSALPRHAHLAAMRDPDEDSPTEIDAREAGLSYIDLDGEIGGMVNGAGLAMATMDIIKLYGGNPANFLDIGGGAGAEKVLSALRIILHDDRVKAVLINIFGGITRCDEVAKGIVEAINTLHVQVPFVVRLVGVNEDEGRQILAESNLVTANSLSEAVQMVVAAAKGEGK